MILELSHNMINLIFPVYQTFWCLKFIHTGCSLNTNLGSIHMWLSCHICLCCTWSTFLIYHPHDLNYFTYYYLNSQKKKHLHFLPKYVAFYQPILSPTWNTERGKWVQRIHCAYNHILFHSLMDKLDCNGQGIVHWNFILHSTRSGFLMDYPSPLIEQDSFLSVVCYN